MLSIMNNLVKMIRIINIFFISLVYINSLDCSQLIMIKLSFLMKTSLKKNIMKRDITTNMNTTMIKKKMSIRWIQRRICFTKWSIIMMSSYLSWICSKNWSIISIHFIYTSLLIYISAVYVNQFLCWIISYINTFNFSWQFQDQDKNQKTQFNHLKL